MKHFTLIYRLLWLFVIFLLAILDRQNIIMVTIIILFVIVLTAIGVLRALESRNEWRKIAEEDKADEIFDKLDK